MLSFQDIVADLNRQLDALSVLRKIDYFPEALVRSGSSIKCFCPIHEEKAFRSLLVDSSRNHYKCSFVKCPGFGGGDLIDLWAKARKVGLPAAAAELAASFQIPFNSAVFADAAEDLARRAVEALEGGKAGAALSLAAEAGELAPHDAGFRRLRAQVLRALGREDEAATVEIEAAALLREGGESDSAIELLEALYGAHPERADLACGLAEALSAAGRRDEAAALLREVCGRQLQLGADQCDPQLLARYLETTPDDLPMRLKAAELFESGGQIKRACGHWETAARQLADRGDSEAAVRILDRLFQIDAKSLPRRALRAAALAMAGKEDEARAEFQALAAAIKASAKMEAAEKVLRETLDLTPDHIGTLQQLAELYEETRRADLAFRCYCRLAPLRHAQGAEAEAAGCLRRARDLAPVSMEGGEALAEALQRCGREAEAAAEVVSLMEMAFEAGHEKDAARYARLASRSRSADVERWLAIVAQLMERGLAEEAGTELAGLARAALDRGEAEKAARACEKGLGFWPGDLLLEEVYAEALGALGRAEEAARALRPLIQLQLEAAAWERAADLLRHALAVLPNDPGFLEQLAEVCVQRNEPTEAARVLQQLAKQLRRQSDPGSARAALMRARELNPGDLSTIEALSSCAEEAGEPDEAFARAEEWAHGAELAGDQEAAERGWRRCAALRPDSIETLRRLGEFLARHRGLDAAMPVFRDVLAMVRATNAGEAIDAAYRDLLELQPGAPGLWSEYIDWLVETGQGQRAVGELRRLQRLYGQDVEKAAERAAVLERLANLLPDEIGLLEDLAEAEEQAGHGGRAAQRLLTIAEAHEARGQAEDALRAYERYLALQPDDVAVRWKSAERLEAQGQADEAAGRRVKAMARWRQAAENFESAGQGDRALILRRRVADLDPERVEDQRVLIDRLIEQGERAEAFRRLIELAERHESSGDLNGALPFYRRAAECGHDDLEAHRHLAVTLLKLGEAVSAAGEMELVIEALIQAGRLAEADEALRWGVEAQPGRRAFLRQKALLLEARGQGGEALEQRLGLAEEAVGAGDLDLAAACLKKLCGKPESPVELRKRLIDLCEAARQPDLANEERVVLAQALLGQGQIEEAKALCDLAIARSTPSAPLRKRIAGLYVEHGIPELAVREYRRLAGELRESGNLEEAIRIAQEGLGIRPNVPLREMLIELLTELNRLDEACAQSFKLVESARALRALDLAESALLRMVRMRGDDPEPRRQLASVLREQGKVEDLERCLADLASLLEQQGDVEGAVEALRDLLAIHPQDMQRRIHYINLYSSIGPEQDLAEDYLALALHYMETGAVVEAMQTFERLIRIEPRHIKARRLFIQFLADQAQHTHLVSETLELERLLVERGADREACEVLEFAVRVAPEEKDLLRALAEAYARRRMAGQTIEAFQRLRGVLAEEGDRLGQIETLRRILQIDPQDSKSRSNLIELLEDEGQIQEAQGHALVQADQYAQRGLYDLAERVYRVLLGRDPENVSIWEKLIETRRIFANEEDLAPDYASLGDLLARKGRLGEARSLFKRILAVDPEQMEIRRRLIEVIIQIGERKERIEQSLELADRLCQREELAEAAELYRQVRQLEPGNRAARQKLAETEKALVERIRPGAGASTVGTGKASTVRRKRLAKASAQTSLQKTIQACKNLLRINPNNAAVRAKLADAYDQMGQADEARQEWDAASAAYLEMGELQQCIEICELLLRRNPQDSHTHERLSRAVLQRDSLRVIDSAILRSKDEKQD